MSGRGDEVLDHRAIESVALAAKPDGVHGVSFQQPAGEKCHVRFDHRYYLHFDAVTKFVIKKVG